MVVKQRENKNRSEFNEQQQQQGSCRLIKRDESFARQNERMDESRRSTCCCSRRAFPV